MRNRIKTMILVCMTILLAASAAGCNFLNAEPQAAEDEIMLKIPNYWAVFCSKREKKQEKSQSSLCATQKASKSYEWECDSYFLQKSPESY